MNIANVPFAISRSLESLLAPIAGESYRCAGPDFGSMVDPRLIVSDELHFARCSLPKRKDLSWRRLGGVICADRIVLQHLLHVDLLHVDLLHVDLGCRRRVMEGMDAERIAVRTLQLVET